MAELRSIGLTSIEIGDVAVDGGMGTTMAPLGVTYQDTAELVRDDPEVTEIYSEENDEPEEVLETKGPAKLRWSLMNVTPEEAVKVLGGTVTGTGDTAEYEAPAVKAAIEKSIKITTKSNLVISIPRAKIYAKENFQFRKKGVLLIDVEARILQPAKEGAAAISWKKVVPSE